MAHLSLLPQQCGDVWGYESDIGDLASGDRSWREANEIGLEDCGEHIYESKRNSLSHKILLRELIQACEIRRAEKIGRKMAYKISTKANLSPNILPHDTPLFMNDPVYMFQGQLIYP